MEEEKYINLEDLENLFNKYFLTLEEKKQIEILEKEALELEKEALELEKIKESEINQISNLSDEEFRTEILTHIKETNDSIKYTNNFIYFSVVTIGTILICTLMYKFLKIFF